MPLRLLGRGDSIDGVFSLVETRRGTSIACLEEDGYHADLKRAASSLGYRNLRGGGRVLAGDMLRRLAPSATFLELLERNYPGALADEIVATHGRDLAEQVGICLFDHSADYGPFDFHAAARVVHSLGGTFLVLCQEGRSNGVEHLAEQIGFYGRLANGQQIMSAACERYFFG